ncbi:MAG: hypothetical protein OEO79_11860 [Gemmatimonadota bacterium]|nr:hypothetical protein [Gemmatimonadota bacterium]MDH3422811.1 hypothetical protein [Gemmatimonadota bacterium]
MAKCALHVVEEPTEVAQDLVARSVAAPASLALAIVQVTFEGFHLVLVAPSDRIVA